MRLLLVGVVSALLAATAATQSAPAQAPSRHCPSGVNGRTVLLADVNSVVTAARAVVIDHKTETNQGRVTKRTVVNYPVVEAVDLSQLSTLRGAAWLRRLAAERCGGVNARYAWAVVFRDANSVLCCVRDVVFVVHLRSGWSVF